MKGQIFGFFVAVLFISCAPSPRDIYYGEDSCSYCKMTIVDQQHAAQAVTDKGKIYVFDAIECMVHFSRDNSEQQYAHLLVNHYTNPKALHAAESSTFLISEALPSPMGAYLNALPDAAKAEELSSELGGEVYNWNELMSELD